MKNLTCDLCNTHLKDFAYNETNMHCKCPPDTRQNGYDICGGVFLFMHNTIRCSNLIQICYKDIELEFDENNFYFSIKKKVIIKGEHNLKFSKNLTNNIEKQLNFLNKHEENLLFL